LAQDDKLSEFGRSDKRFVFSTRPMEVSAIDWWGKSLVENWQALLWTLSFRSRNAIGYLQLFGSFPDGLCFDTLGLFIASNYYYC